jgi:hypothetical protein
MTRYRASFCHGSALIAFRPDCLSDFGGFGVQDVFHQLFQNFVRRDSSKPVDLGW